MLIRNLNSPAARYSKPDLQGRLGSMASPSDTVCPVLLEMVEGGLVKREGSIATQGPDRFLVTAGGWEAARE